MPLVRDQSKFRKGFIVSGVLQVKTVQHLGLHMRRQCQQQEDSFWQGQVFFAYKRLVRKTISINAKVSFIQRHIVYVVIMLLLWEFVLLLSYNQISVFKILNAKFTDNYNSFDNIDIASSVAIFSTGIFLSIIRVIDPYFQH